MTTNSFVHEPEWNNKILTMMTQNTYIFVFSCTSYKMNLIQGMYPASCMNLRTIFAIFHEFQWCEGGLHPLLYKHMHLIIHFNLGVTQWFLHIFFFSMPFNIFRKMHVANIDVSQQHITSSIVKFNFKNLSSNTFYHLHITMNSENTK
jgi:hypothetical protein